MSSATTRKASEKRSHQGSRHAEKTEGSVKVTPIRFEPALRLGLEMLRRTVGTPVNKLVNQAVEDYLKRRTAEVETDLKSLLRDIKEYRKQDPDFEKMLRMTAQEEALAVKRGIADPAEGYRLGEKKRRRTTSTDRRKAARG